MKNMPTTDVAIIDLLRKRTGMTIPEFVEALQVTATAIRQRLNRLLAQGHIERAEIRNDGRGRPGHRYLLTETGRRQAGANFVDLAIALWQEIRSIDDPDVRRGLMQRISSRLAGFYQDSIVGADTKERMESLVELFGHRDIPLEIAENSSGNELPVLNVFACPYPTLAEQDRSVCSMERMLFSELLGTTVKLSRCRLDGESCCTFEVN